MQPFSDEVVAFPARRPTREEVIAFRPSQVANARVTELIGKEKAGDITATESAEPDRMFESEQVIRLAKAQAIQAIADRTAQ